MSAPSTPASGPSTGADLVTMGECLVAFVAEDVGPLSEATAFKCHIAGAEANVAIGVARLGYRSAFIGRLGNDPFGAAILRRLRAEEVNVSAVVVDPTSQTGLLVRNRRTVGPSEVLYYRMGSAGSRLDADDVRAAEPLFRGARWLHLTGITPALSTACATAVLTALELAQSHGLMISLDVNLRRRLWSENEAAAALRPIAAAADLILASPDEGRLLAGLSAEADPVAIGRVLLDLGPSTVVIKRGPSGALELERDGPVVSRPAVPVGVAVDPVGAGDAFCAGWITGRLDGLDVAACLDLANACAAYAISTIGDVEGLPSRAEADQLIANAHRQIDDPIR